MTETPLQRTLREDLEEMRSKQPADETLQNALAMQVRNKREFELTGGRKTPVRRTTKTKATPLSEDKMAALMDLEI